MLAAPGREVSSCALHICRNRVSASWPSQGPGGERDIGEAERQTGATSPRASEDLKAREFALSPVGALTGLDRSRLRSDVHSETQKWNQRGRLGGCCGSSGQRWETCVDLTASGEPTNSLVGGWLCIMAEWDGEPRRLPVSE